MLNSKNILIIDDDFGILDVLKLLLTEEGYKVQTASTGKECLKCLEEANFDLILLDILIAGEDGSDIAKIIKSNKLYKDIPIILISADMQIEQKAQEANVDGYIKKPFDIDEILTIIHKTLSLKS